MSEQQDPTLQAVAATAARARQRGTGQPLGGVGPEGSKLDPRSTEQRVAQEAATQPGPPAQPLGGVDPNPRPPTERQTRRVDTGGVPLGGVGPAGSSIARFEGGVGGVVGKNEAQLHRDRQNAAAERQRLADEAAKTAQPPQAPAAKKAAKKATKKTDGGDGGK